MPKCLTRFYLDGWEWKGDDVYLQSRAIDETGYVQPQMTELQKVRGVNSIYHNNAIQTWHITKSGRSKMFAWHKVIGTAVVISCVAIGSIDAAERKYDGVGRTPNPEEIKSWTSMCARTGRVRLKGTERLVKAS